MRVSVVPGRKGFLLFVVVQMLPLRKIMAMLMRMLNGVRMRGAVVRMGFERYFKF